MKLYDLFEALVGHDMPRSEKYSSDRADFEVQPQLGELIDRIEAGEIEPKIVNINPQKLQATQGWLDTHNGGGTPLLDRYTKLPVILKDQSGYHILDGHHRTSHALSKGQQLIKVYLFRMPADLSEASFADLKKRIPSFLVDEWHEATGIPKKVLYLYGELGQDQRARPEQVMVQLQPYVSGVLDFCIEHVGDLSNRATPNHGLNWSWGSVKEKAEKTYRTLTHSYGFEREFEENLAANAQYRGLDLAEYKKKVDAGLKQYAAAHTELLKNAHCPLHKNCVRAAVALGKKDFAGAATFLENILALVKTKESYVAALRDYEPKLNQTLAGEEVLDEAGTWWDQIKGIAGDTKKAYDTAVVAGPRWQAAIDSKDPTQIEQGIKDLAKDLGMDSNDPKYKQWAGSMRYKAYKAADIKHDVTRDAERKAYAADPRHWKELEIPGYDEPWVTFSKPSPRGIPLRVGGNKVNEEALERFEIGMGLEQMHNNDIALVGGMRSGSSPAGLTRLRYSIYDVPMLKQLKQDGGDQYDAHVGYVELMVEDGSGNLAGLINIEMKRGSKRAGYGEQVIRSIMDSPFAQKPFKIYDIQKKALGFWKKMGVEFTRSDFKTPIAPTQLPTLALGPGNIFGIIR
jgi:hypothetical protein